MIKVQYSTQRVTSQNLSVILMHTLQATTRNKTVRVLILLNPEHVIKYAGCPMVWFSNLHSEIAHSTIEEEYIILSTAAQKVLPLGELIFGLKPILSIPEASL